MAITSHQIKTLARGRYIRHIKNDSVYRFNGLIKCRHPETSIWSDYYAYVDIKENRYSREANDFQGFDLIEPSIPPARPKEDYDLGA